MSPRAQTSVAGVIFGPRDVCSGAIHSGVPSAAVPVARTSAVVYTKVPGGPFGMPRSIIEGMCASTSVVLPDRPEAPLIAGPKCRTYRSADDIVRHVSEALAGGPGVRSEQEFNRTFAYTHFADPSLAVTFTAELSDAVNAWRGA